MAPVLLLGLLILFLANRFLTPSLVHHLQQRTDSELHLASELGLSICDGMLSDLLDLRLENSPEVISSMKLEALEQIKGLRRKFHAIELMVVDQEGKILASTLKGKVSGPLPPPAGVSSRAFTLVVDGRRMRAYSTYFPFWRWNILSLISEDDYLAPRRMATWVVNAATAAVLLATLLTLLIAFHLLVNRPLKRIIKATSEVAQGRFVRLPTRRRDEIGRVQEAFNTMVDSLEQGSRRIDQILHQLSESEYKYRSLTEHSLAYITIVQDGRLVYANRRLSEALGYRNEECLGMKVLDLVHPDDRPRMLESVRKQLREGQPVKHYAFRAITKSGEVRWLEILASPIVYQGRNATLAHGIDVTSRKEAEARQRRLQERLQHSQKMEVVGILAGGIAHDFNNVLQAISGYVQLLLLDSNLDEPQRAHLRGIQDSARRGSELVNQLLTFGRRAETRKEPVDLNKEVLRTCRMLERTIPRMISIEMNLAPDLRRIKADPTQLDQILMNLGSNAKDAMPAGGRLVFETSNVRLDQEFCQGLSGCTAGDYVLLKVSDDGEGMDPHTLEHIFEPFFTTKGVGKGTGLGLSTVYGIVKAHGGHITCQSRPGGGTTFCIYLPAMSEDEVSQAAETEPEAQPGQGNELILVVDDERPVQQILKEALEHYGYQVLEASSGEEALDIYTRRAGQVDLVILDLGMPGMGGRRCLEELLRRDPEARVIVATGYSADGQAREITQAGAVGFMAKPYQLSELLAKVRQVLEETPPRRPGGGLRGGQGREGLLH